MAAKHLISPGIGFSPGHVKFIVTRGLTSLVFVSVSRVDLSAPATRRVDLSAYATRRVDKKAKVL